MNSPDDTSDQVTDAPEDFGVPGPTVPSWSPEDLKLLGTKPDGEAAQLLNRTPSAVRHRCHKLRISAYQSPFHCWTPEEERLLGTMPDEEVVARTGHPLSGVIQRRRTLHAHLPRPGHRPWTSEENKLLGTIKD